MTAVASRDRAARPGIRPARGGAPRGRAAVRRARLHLPARPGGGDRRSRVGDRAAPQLRAARRRRCRRAPLRGAVLAAGRAAGGAAARRARSAGTSRRGRATSDTGRRAQMALARGGDVAAGHTATDQVETILYRLASSPSRRALLGMRPREGLLVRPLLEFTREQTAAYCTARGLTLARGREQRLRRVRPQPDPGPARAGAARGAPGRLRTTCSRWPRSCATRRRARRAGRRGAGRTRRDRSSSRLRELAAGAGRLVVQRLADDAAGGLAPGVARRAAEIAALDEHGTAQLDTGGGVVAIAEYGVLRFESRASRSAGATPEPVLPADPGERHVRRAARSPASSDRRRASPAWSTARPSATICWCGPGGPVTGWRRSGCRAPRACRTCSRRGGSRGASARAVPWSSPDGEIVWVAGVATRSASRSTEYDAARRFA